MALQSHMDLTLNCLKASLLLLSKLCYKYHLYIYKSITSLGMLDVYFALDCVPGLSRQLLQLLLLLAIQLLLFKVESTWALAVSSSFSFW